jgi:hypothetical protein
VGGSAPAGGTIGVGGGVSTGGTTGGFAGSIPTGGVAGTVGVGGADPCTECPPAAYGLTVHGDGLSYELAYNGYLLADSDQVYCAEQPLRGTFGGCGGVGVSACEHPMSVPPCLSVRGTSATYVDGRTGEWTGSVTGIVFSNRAPMVASGTFGLELSNADGGFLALTVDYTLCEFGLRGVAGICR